MYIPCDETVSESDSSLHCDIPCCTPCMKTQPVVDFSSQPPGFEMYVPFGWSHHALFLAYHVDDSTRRDREILVQIPGGWNLLPPQSTAANCMELHCLMDKTALVAVVDSSKQLMRLAAGSRAGDAAPEEDGERDWEESVLPSAACVAEVNCHMSYTRINEHIYGRCYQEPRVDLNTRKWAVAV